MTALRTASTARYPVGSIVNSLDRLVSQFRRWAEDRLPWYDREEEERRIARTESIRRRSVNERIRAEAILAQSRFGKR